MYQDYRPGDEFQYSCWGCGYEREGLLDAPNYNWACPKCWRSTSPRVVKVLRVLVLGNVPEK